VSLRRWQLSRPQDERPEAAGDRADATLAA
jgi:hypothetical protein